MLGYSFEDLLSIDLESANFNPDYPREGFKQALETGGEVRGIEAKWKTKDGTEIHISENARVVRAQEIRPLRSGIPKMSRSVP